MADYGKFTVNYLAINGVIRMLHSLRLGGIRSQPKSFKTLPSPRKIMTGASLYTAGKRANVLLLRLESFETAVCNSN